MQPGWPGISPLISLVTWSDHTATTTVRTRRRPTGHSFRRGLSLPGDTSHAPQGVNTTTRDLQDRTGRKTPRTIERGNAARGRHVVHTWAHTADANAHRTRDETPGDRVLHHSTNPDRPVKGTATTAPSGLLAPSARPHRTRHPPPPGQSASQADGADRQRRIRRQIERTRWATRGDEMRSQRGDHRTVVRAQPRSRHTQLDTRVRAAFRRQARQP